MGLFHDIVLLCGGVVDNRPYALNYKTLTITDGKFFVYDNRYRYSREISNHESEWINFSLNSFPGGEMSLEQALNHIFNQMTNIINHKAPCTQMSSSDKDEFYSCTNVRPLWFMFSVWSTSYCDGYGPSYKLIKVFDTPLIQGPKLLLTL